MELLTREYGPNAKGSKLTIQEMDDNLLFLESLGLTGTNYIYVAANGTDTENATSLQTAYTTAKTMSPSSTNRIKIIAAPGKYNFGTSIFTLDTQYIDLVSLDGDRSVIFNAELSINYPYSEGSIRVNTDNVFLKGIDVQTKNFEVYSNLNNLFIENCIGGEYSFGGNNTITGTFINCEGGDRSFAGNNGTTSGTFIDCKSGNYSFGTSGASGTFVNCTGIDISYSNASGIFINCTGNFGSQGTCSGTFTNCTGNFANSGLASGIFTNCVGDNASFGGGGSGTLTGKLYYCRLTSGTFKTVSGGGVTRYCLDGNNTANNQG
jgi:hypothetical protein